jgi:hypothetical protein
MGLLSMSAPSMTALAKAFCVNRKTIFRWKKAGVNVEDPASVSDYVTKHNGHSLETLVAIAEALLEQSANTSNPFQKS